MASKGSSNALKKGDNENTQFGKWLRSVGLELPAIPEPNTGSLVEDYKMKALVLKEREKLLEGYIMLYKSIGGRGATALGMLMELDAEILLRKDKVRSMGGDILEDASLQDAEKRKFEIIKFLDKLKFDKEKAYVELIATKADKDEDFAFEYDAEYVQKVKKDENATHTEEMR